MSADDPHVLHLGDQSRFVVRLDGSEAELVYEVRRDCMILVHTGVPEELGGRGLGRLLVSAAVAHAASVGLVVAPWCPFARRLLEQHPEMAAGVTVDWTPPQRIASPHADADAGSAGLEAHLDEQEEESFPASDSHSDWAGPAS